MRAALDNDGVVGEEERKNTGNGKRYERAERWKLRLRVKGAAAENGKRVRENRESGVR